MVELLRTTVCPSLDKGLGWLTVCSSLIVTDNEPCDTAAGVTMTWLLMTTVPVRELMMTLAAAAPGSRARTGAQPDHPDGEERGDPEERPGRRGKGERAQRCERRRGPEAVLDTVGQIQHPDGNEHERGQIEVRAAEPVVRGRGTDRDDGPLSGTDR